MSMTAVELPVAPKWDAPLRIGSIELASHFNLAPLAGYTNLPFRQSVRELGGLGLATTDLVNARAIIENSKKSIELLATCPEDVPLAVQIFGGVPEELAHAAKWLEDRGTKIVDINMGCPVRKVVKTGGGSALLCNVASATDLVEKVVRAVRIPITVKMRLGWDDDNITAPEYARLFEEIGVAAITIHGRTREQGFSGEVKLDGIRAVVESVKSIPIIGNGDVRTLAEATRMVEETGCAGVAIGRGSLANPWLFRQLVNWQRTGDPGPRGTYHERIAFMDTHVRRLCDWRGDQYGCVMFRKISSWYSKALRVGREIQQGLIRLESLTGFADIVNRLNDQGPPKGWSEWDASDSTISVPTGPIAHW